MDPSPNEPGPGQDGQQTAAQAVDAILAILQAPSHGHLDGLLEHLPDQVIDLALATRKRKGQGVDSSPPLSFAEVLELDHTGPHWRLDSFAMRHLIFSRPTRVTPLSSLLVAPERSVHRFEVQNSSGEVCCLTLTLALEEALQSQYRTAPRITRAWRLRGVTGEPGGGDDELATRPDVSLGPEATVMAQIHALQRVDAATVFAFASPGNQAATGPLARFAEMLRSPQYAPMLGHVRAERLNRVQLSAVGYVEVVAVIAPTNIMGGITSAGQPSVYLFELGKESADSDTVPNCWVTHSVRLVSEVGPMGM